MDSHQKRLPSVFEYLDVLFYLQDYYRYRKANDRNFSYEIWSQELEFKSRSFLRMIVTGKKKITPKMIDAFSRQNFSLRSEADYFHCLVKYSQSRDPKDKQVYSAKMIQLMRSHSTEQIIEDYNDFISSPLLPRLLALLSFEDLQKTDLHIAKILNVSLSEAQLALQKLSEMGLIEQQSDEWVAKTDAFHVPDQYGNFNLMKFHEKSLLDAIQAFEKPKELRRYKSLLLPMNETDLQEFHRLLDDFSNEQMVRFQSATYSGKRMYQANFNVYSVTESIDTDQG